MESVAGPQLNALKTVADGCSQLAEQIKMIYGDLRGRLGAVDDRSKYLSITPLEEIQALIVRAAPDSDVARLVRTAFELVKDARDAADRNFANRVARSLYLAAAGKFRDVIERVGPILAMKVDPPRTVEWHLKIEEANALIFSLPAKLRDASRQEKQAYECARKLYAELETGFPDDPVVQLRLAQAERKDVDTPEGARGVVVRLERCLSSARHRRGFPSAEERAGLPVGEHRAWLGAF